MRHGSNDEISGDASRQKGGGTPVGARFAAAMDALAAAAAIAAGGRILAAVSGGSDSTALLLLLAEWCRDRGVWLGVAHFNHGLRGAASDGDEAFVSDTARRLGLPFSRGAPSAPLLSQPGSLEQVARAARRDFFARAAREQGATAVCTGHTRDDVAETLLLRLLRGAGAAGLSGLRPLRPLPAASSDTAGGNGVPLFLLRPLLECSHAGLRSWLAGRGEAWREDASNADVAIPRNRVRHLLLPALERAMPDAGGESVRVALARSSGILREEDEFLDSLAREAFAAARAAPVSPDALRASPADFLLDGAALRGHPPALRRRIVRLALMGWGNPAGFDTVERILALLGAPPGACVDVDGAHEVRRTAEGLLFRDVSSGETPLPGLPELRLPASGEVRWGDYLVRVEAVPGIVRDGGPAGRFPATCSLSRSAVEAAGGLRVRARRPGDRIAPLGLAGSRKLQDILVDAAIPREARDRFPVVCAGGEPAWVPGYRIGRRFALRSDEEPALRVSIVRT